MERGALDRLVGRLASHGQNAFIAFLVIAVFVRVAVLVMMSFSERVRGARS